jgi:dTDP-4-amino-4,6-dideoxygalactose transaminase
MEVPFVDLTAQYKALKRDIDNAIGRVVSSGRFIQGPEVSLFEKEFADFLGTSHCVGVNSGTDALILGMRAFGIGLGDEVIIPVNTYIATAIGASENGATPVFVDIDPDGYGMDLVELKKKLSPKTKAVIAVHLFGQPEKIDEIEEVIRRTGKKIYLIEDACQAHGATYQRKRVGTFGVFSAFSFYPGKNLGAYGDGGALVTSDGSVAERARMLREYGQRKKYIHESLGVNSRLDAIQAAVLRVKLPYLDRWNKKRQELADYYTKRLKSAVPSVTTPMWIPKRPSVFHLYIIQVDKRDSLLKRLHENGVESLIHYPIPLHLQGAYRYLGYKRGDFPRAEAAADRILSLPMHPDLTKRQVDYVVDTIKRVYEA